MPERLSGVGQLSLRAVSLAVVLGVVLSGCAGSPAPVASPSSAVPVPTAAPTAVPEPDPTLKPQLAASENLAYFDFLSKGALATNPSADGKAFIDALVAGGFDKAQMEVTFDRTAADLAADSIQFSVRFNDECLIGQNGPASGGYQSMVAPVLGTGKCLVGATRPIDW